MSDVVITFNELQWSGADGRKEMIPLSVFRQGLFTDYEKKGSYLAECPRDEKGHCKKRGGEDKTSESKPKPPSMNKSKLKSTERRGTTPTPKISTTATQGFSFHVLPSGSTIEGYAVLVYSEEALSFSINELQPVIVAKFWMQNKDALDKDKHYLGVWSDSEGKVNLGVFVLVDNENMARALASIYEQESYFDTKKGLKVDFKVEGESNGAGNKALVHDDEHKKHDVTGHSGPVLQSDKEGTNFGADKGSQTGDRRENLKALSAYNETTGGALVPPAQFMGGKPKPRIPITESILYRTKRVKTLRSKYRQKSIDQILNGKSFVEVDPLGVVK